MAKPTEQAMLSHRELSVFCAQVAMLLRSGIAVPEGIRIMLEDNESREGKEILSAVLAHCELGAPLSEALSETGVFPKYLIDMARIGEASGRLDEVMFALQRHYEREESVGKSIRSAVRYPAIMIVMMLLVVGVLIVKVLPIFSEVFAQLGTEMSGLSGSIMQMGLTLSRYSVVLVAVVFALALFAAFCCWTAPGKQLRRRLGMHFFLTRHLFERMASARFASGMALMLSSGLDPDESLAMVAKLVDHPLLEARIAACQKQMEEGESFAAALVSTKLFSGVYGRMISIGFKTGSADTVMQELADRYSEEVADEVNDKIFLIEPTLVAVFSVLVGIILLSVMLPLMGIMSSIG